MTPLMQQANQVLNAKNRGFMEGVISTTELYNSDKDKAYIQLEVTNNLIKLDMPLEDIEYWINEYFPLEEIK